MNFLTINNLFKILIFLSIINPIEVLSIENKQTYINEYNYSTIWNNYDSKSFFKKKYYRDRTRLRKIPKCEEEQNTVGYASTSSFLIAMRPEPLPKCTPIRIPKV
jgi:hypothetical protein